MKLVLLLAIGVISGAAWLMHGVPGSSKTTSAGTPAAPVLKRLSRDQLAEAARKNDPLREQLAKQYPDSYRALQQQAPRDLKDCVVTKVADGVLQALCP